MIIQTIIYVSIFFVIWILSMVFSNILLLLKFHMMHPDFLSTGGKLWHQSRYAAALLCGSAAVIAIINKWPHELIWKVGVLLIVGFGVIACIDKDTIHALKYIGKPILKMLKELMQ